jgi:hypothetical protein
LFLKIILKKIIVFKSVDIVALFSKTQCFTLDLHIVFYLVSVVAIVTALPCPETSGRLLLLLKEDNEKPSSKRSKNSSYKVGSLVDAEVCGFL